MTTSTKDDGRSVLSTPDESTTILRSVQDLLPVIAARSEEIERARRLPLDLVARLRGAGCFRILVPRRFGGAGLGLPDHTAMVRQLARADGSVGWTVMIGSAAPVILGKLPDETLAAVYASGPDVVVAGAFNPTGVATPVDGGFRVSGRWAFASGCQHADWFIAHCVVDDGRVPPLRMMVAPAADVETLDTWMVSGMCGTGSHDFTMDDRFVPTTRTFAVFEDGGIDGPLGLIPELALSSLGFANVALGIAEGALMEITTLATAKVPMFASGTLAANPLFRNQLGSANAQLAAARALHDAAVASVWASASSGEAPTLVERARIRAAATWVTAAAAAVVDTAYSAGGGTALYLASPLQRRLRDVRAITQHFAVKPDTFTLAGGVLAGQDVDTTFL